MAKASNRRVPVPDGVEVAINGGSVTVKGKHGEIALDLRSNVSVSKVDAEVAIEPQSMVREDLALAGTYQALIRNMVYGVSERWEKRLQLQGTGYRARAESKNLNLALGFSSPIDFPIPVDIEITTPTQNEVVVTGVDRQRVGQVAAEIRSLRPPEPYKGKGVRYKNETVRRKEGKKK